MDPPTARTAACFFFQAEDGIRDYKVTGVQTCALPIWSLGECWTGNRQRRRRIRRRLLRIAAKPHHSGDHPESVIARRHGGISRGYLELQRRIWASARRPVRIDVALRNQYVPRHAL